MEQELARPSIEQLNEDILLRIFDYLHFVDKIRLRRTCWRWRLLLESQLSKAKALRVGLFQQGGYHITSGLQLHCNHQSANHRQHTGTLADTQILSYPADLETQCFNINQYDCLHRSLHYCKQNITMLSLGRLNVTYRLLMVIAHNLPKLEHLELIGCASGLHQQPTTTAADKGGANGRKKRPATTVHMAGLRVPLGHRQMPSIETFNSSAADLSSSIYSTIAYNQHPDHRINMEERLVRSALVKNCDLVRESKLKNYWPNLSHLLVKDCNLLNEFSLSLIMAITSQTLVHLAVESNQYLTGEFLNYSGPQLKILRLKYCPMLQVKFLEDLVRIKQLLSPANTSSHTDKHDSNTTSTSSSSSSPPLHHQPQPTNSSMFRNFRNTFNQDIHCTL